MTLSTVDNKSNFYNGNSALKKKGVDVEVTWDQLEELTKCRNSVVYFIENYVKIISMDDGMILFKPFLYQCEMLDIMEKNRFSIFLLPRQMGKTTIVAAFLLHQAIFNEKYTIAILANKAEQSREIMSRLQIMYEELPWFIQPGVVVWNKGDIELGNRSKVFCAATTGSSIRGKSANLIYLDEFAHVENDLEFYESTYPVVTSGDKTKVIITSTPNGMNLFYKIWSDSVEGRNSYVHKKVHWSEHPKRNKAWKDIQVQNMSQKQFDQEFECEFLGSSDTLISGSKLQKLFHMEPINKDLFYRIYEAPQKDHSYVVTVDTAEGIGKDYSVVTVIDVTNKPFTQVAVYRSNIIPPLMLADVAFTIGTSYNQGVIVVETNSVGAQVAQSLWHDYEYENMLTTKTSQSENKEFGGARAEIGVRTTTKTKLIGCSTLKALIEGDTLIIRDLSTIMELTTFIKKGKKYEAEKNKTDDIVMSLVIFSWFTSQPYFLDMVDLNMRELMRNNLASQEDYQAVIGFMDDGTGLGFDDDNSGFF